MTEIDPLTAMRAKLKPRQEARDRPGTSDIDGQLDALMAEISETIPPRDMTLGDGNGQETRRLVARPHLLRVGRARPAARAAAARHARRQGRAAHRRLSGPGPPLCRRRRRSVDHRGATDLCRVEPTEPGCPSMRCARSSAMKGPLLKAPPDADRTTGAAPEGDDPVGACLVRVARGTETALLAPGTKLAAIVAACRPRVPLDRSGAPD
ncbi:Myo-inositol transporter [Rhodovulum sulfidophilum]|uniref:Myo-inositol transporter n=1 Tax=Rhodovulum sulfidophilum TaxID=35806 RepID=A0A0D6AY85_RHOSU|nr:Myo-inositol transporter [Rhodovulum sulfidophilum]